MAGDLHVFIKWSDPAKVVTKYGARWVRSWVIPKDWLQGFFIFWNGGKDKLRAQGYSIGKNKLGAWTLSEWQLNKKDLREKFGKDNPPVVFDIPTESTLPAYIVKNVNGLREWQVPNVAKLTASLLKNKAAIDGSDTGCHAKGQGILMYDGSVKLVENIEVGDLIMGWDSTPREVEILIRGKQQMAKISPVKGDEWIVNMDHVLTVKLTNGPSPTHTKTGGYKYGDIVDIKVSDYLKLKKATKHAMKLFTSSEVNCWADTEQPIEPYLLGILLGDGGLSCKSCITYTSIDRETWSYIRQYQNDFGGNLGNTSEDITKRLTNSPLLFGHMRFFGLLPIKCEDRFIPNIYKICSKKQRLEILAGLIDTDGWVDKTSLSFCSKSKKLRDDVSFIARSLGFFVTNRIKQSHCFYKGEKRCGTYYYSTMIGDLSEIPLKIKRKLPPTRIIKKQHNVVGFTVEPLNEDDYYGFSISGDGRYLLDDFTVTHNSGKTYTAIGVAREMGMKIAVVCPKAVINSWKRAITNHFKLKYEFVLNYESVKTGKYKDIGVWQDVSRTSNKQFFKWNLPKNTLIIFDESHKLKGHGTQNSEMALEAKKQGYHILCCSATNAVDPVELKTVGLILGVYKRGKWRAFLEEHGCEQGRFGWEFNGDKNILKKLHHDLFIERGVRLSKRDIPNFPDCDTIVEAYNMDDKSEKDINEAYAEMERELTLLRIKCKNTKEYQINSMVIQLRARQRAELIKVPLLVEMAEDAIESGMSVVIFLNFSESVKALSKRLKTNCIVWGENKGDERQRNIDAFQADTERIIIVNVKAGGAGLSLHDLNGQFARMSLISPTPSAVDLRQALGRIHRDGAKSKALQKIIFVANTEEEKTCEKVKLKLENLDTINDGDVLIGNNL
jgi:hypothetical protein